MQHMKSILVIFVVALVAIWISNNVGFVKKITG